jgi:hypothetical protein
MHELPGAYGGMEDDKDMERSDTETSKLQELGG